MQNLTGKPAWTVVRIVILASCLLFLACGPILPIPTVAQIEQPGEENPQSIPSLEESGASAANLLYLPAVLRAVSPQVLIKSIWIADSAGITRTSFLKGEAVKFYVNGTNGSGKSVPATITWKMDGACGVTVLYRASVTLDGSAWVFNRSASIPRCNGITIYTVDLTVEHTTTTLQIPFVVTDPSLVVAGTRQAFDKCNVPTLDKMQTWWNASPYYSVNLYLGGALRFCANTELTSFWVHEAKSQGWSFIPTWVGPQAPCSKYRVKMSANLTTARQQGRQEADAAAAAARAVGFLGDHAIYYDLEGYYGEATLSCRNAVESFMQGWVERLHQLGYQAGGYGSPYGSFISDWATIATPPDVIWIASWNRQNYDPNISVFNINYLSNSLWPNHQRIRQYAGDHVETWGGLAMTIDSNAVDGGITSFPGNDASTQDKLVAVAPDAVLAALSDFQMVSESAGWVLSAGKLLWTNDGGASWSDRTPQVSGALIAGQFLDDNSGYLASYDANEDRVNVQRTQDGGLTWQQSPLTADRLALDTEIAGAQVYFVDQQTGWVALTLGTSSNFSRGELFRTRDGGLSWQKLSLPAGGQIRFEDVSTGWLTGGVEGNEQYLTTDGGQSWSLTGVDAGSSDSLETATGEPVLLRNQLLGLNHVDFISAQAGWAMIHNGDCSGSKDGAEEALQCVQTRRLVRTVDGGSTWVDITPPAELIQP